jgi:hypothetical protein
VTARRARRARGAVAGSVASVASAAGRAASAWRRGPGTARRPRASSAPFSSARGVSGGPRARRRRMALAQGPGPAAPAHGPRPAPPDAARGSDGRLRAPRRCNAASRGVGTAASRLGQPHKYFAASFSGLTLHATLVCTQAARRSVCACPARRCDRFTRCTRGAQRRGDGRPRADSLERFRCPRAAACAVQLLP